MVNLYRRFVLDAAKIMAPLNNLLKRSNKGNIPIQWTEATVKAFSEKPKQGLANATLLAHPKIGAPKSITVNASTTRQFRYLDYISQYMTDIRHLKSNENVIRSYSVVLRTSNVYGF